MHGHMPLHSNKCKCTRHQLSVPHSTRLCYSPAYVLRGAADPLCYDRDAVNQLTPHSRHVTRAGPAFVLLQLAPVPVSQASPAGIALVGQFLTGVQLSGVQGPVALQCVLSLPLNPTGAALSAMLRGRTTSPVQLVGFPWLVFSELEVAGALVVSPGQGLSLETLSVEGGVTVLGAPSTAQIQVRGKHRNRMSG